MEIIWRRAEHRQWVNLNTEVQGSHSTERLKARVPDAELDGIQGTPVRDL